MKPSALTLVINFASFSMPAHGVLPRVDTIWAVRNIVKDNLGELTWEESGISESTVTLAFSSENEAVRARQLLAYRGLHE